ncbi:MAG: phosphatase PAP2 family protein [Chloroflexi bacterium]|nr:phosphatase PAP2 family protein [Chloroflexota bacterium]
MTEIEDATGSKKLIPLAVALLGIGLALAYESSRHLYFSFDLDLTQRVQAVRFPGLAQGLGVVNGLTNFYPGAAIWLATVIVLLRRGFRIEALTLTVALVPFLAGEALGVLVDRPRPDPALVRVAQALKGNGFPSGHVIGATVFYGALASFAAYRARSPAARALALAAVALVVSGAGLARVYRGAHWPSDVLGGLLLGGAALVVLIWIYARLRAGRVRVLGIEFIVARR